MRVFFLISLLGLKRGRRKCFFWVYFFKIKKKKIKYNIHLKFKALKQPLAQIGIVAYLRVLLTGADTHMSCMMTYELYC